MLKFDISFNKKSHTFTAANGERYDSVSKILKSVTPIFDAEKIAVGYAKKFGETPAYWVELWAAKGKASAERGTMLHAVIQQIVLGSAVEGEITDSPNMRGFIADVMKTHNIVGVELPMCHHGYKIAGIADFVAQNKETGKLWLLDWKATERIDRINTYGEYLFTPVEYLDNCHYTKYGLQLSFYAAMLISAGYEVERRCIAHITPDWADEFGNIELIDTPYYEAEIASIIAAFRGETPAKVQTPVNINSLSDILSKASEIAAAVNDGHISPLMVAVELKKIAKAVEYIEKETKASVLSEAEKYKGQSVYGAKIDVIDRGRYSYEHIDSWAALETEIETLKLAQKAIETVAQAAFKAGKDIVDPITGEVTGFRAKRESNPSVTITLDKK